jgi:hypothetical protein
MVNFTQEVVIQQQYNEIKRGKIDGFDIYFQGPGGNRIFEVDNSKTQIQPDFRDNNFRIFFTENELNIRRILDNGDIDFTKPPIFEVSHGSWFNLKISDYEGSQIDKIKPFTGTMGSPTYVEIQDKNFIDNIKKSLTYTISVRIFPNKIQAEQEGQKSGFGNKGELPIEVMLDRRYDLAGRKFQDIELFFERLEVEGQPFVGNTYQVFYMNPEMPPSDQKSMKETSQGLFFNFDSVDDTKVVITEVNLGGSHDSTRRTPFLDWKEIWIVNHKNNKNPVESVKGRFESQNTGISGRGKVNPTSDPNLFETGEITADKENAEVLILTRVANFDKHKVFADPDPGTGPHPGIINDVLGVRKIYKEASNGIQWLFTKENQEWFKDIGEDYKKTIENGIIQILKKENKDVKDMKVKLMVCADGKTGEDIKDCKFKERREKGFTVSNKDWKNVEFTAYFQYVSGGCTGKGRRGGDYLSIVLRTCQNKEKVCGAAYRVNLDLCSAGVWAEKEYYHIESKEGVKTEKSTNTLIDNGLKDLANTANNRYLGIKVIICNDRNDTNPEKVELGIFVDKSNENNQWQGVKSWVDKKDTGSSFPMYNEKDLKDDKVDKDEIEQLITFGAPQVILEMNNTEFNIKKLSVREIEVPLKKL